MARYEAKTSFGYYKLVSKGDVIELNENEYGRYMNLVDKIPEHEEPVSSMNHKPNKLYKRGRRKKI